MAQFLKAVKRHQQIILSAELPAATTIWLGSMPLSDLGYRGELRRVNLRLDSTSPAGGVVDLYIADMTLSPLFNTPADETVFYSNLGAALVPSDTDASIEDNLGAVGGSDYDVDPQESPAVTSLGIGGRLTTGGAGTYTFFCDVWAEVQL